MSDFWTGRPVLITGSTGLLGTWLTSALVKRGAHVTGLSRKDGLTDEGKITDLLNQRRIDTVYHLAALTDVRQALTDPLPTFETNIRGTWTILEAIRKTPSVRQVIVSSSDKVYGTREKQFHTEADPLNCIYPYDVSKLCADAIARSYATTWSMNVCVTRCANLYGGHDLNWNRLIPGTIRSILRNERPVIRSDGKSVRDYLYVEDAVTAHLLMAEQMVARDIRGHAFNLCGMEASPSVSELVDTIIKAMASDLVPEIRNNASNEIPSIQVNAVKAWIILKWRPEYTMEQGLTRTIDWYRSNRSVI